MAATLGYEIVGHGPEHVIVMHDWFGDRSTWDPLRPYLTTRLFTYAFVDLRGYGQSRGIEGQYSLEEASTDVLALVQHLRWKRFAVVGHSMSSLVMQRLLQLAPERITRAIGVTPVPPTSLRIDDAMLAMTKKLALAWDDERLHALRDFWGTRLSDAWIELKAKRWGECAERKAVAAYVDMYGRTDISGGARRVTTPMLLVAAEQDAPPFRKAELERTMLPYYPHAEIVTLLESGHYPMQEQPPLMATCMERFLRQP